MSFPKNLDELKSAGYTFSNHGTCRGCYADIEWWKTPGGSPIPMQPMDRGTSPAVAHSSVCPNQDEFKRER